MLLNPKPIRLLVLCTGNSARSIMAEALFNRLFQGRIQAFSAGSQPTGRVNPLALEQLGNWEAEHLPRSKSWDEFLDPEATPLDIMLTVCGNAGQACPQFPGAPERVHWDLPDPAAVQASEDSQRDAFSQCYATLHTRISQLQQQLAGQPEQTLIPAAIARLMRSISDKGQTP
ncbi:MAG: protein-tyrosine-phosphatase [Gammaproteobacteria bacterium HGW-Gammaproteobacteria-11]|nr:MAG: protein-tyrosine-phosphatase [Gammaproteobacteria bacterium HGW-Gammaproteobacteria-11]